MDEKNKKILVNTSSKLSLNKAKNFLSITDSILSKNSKHEVVRKNQQLEILNWLHNNPFNSEYRMPKILDDLEYLRHICISVDTIPESIGILKNLWSLKIGSWSPSSDFARSGYGKGNVSFVPKSIGDLSELMEFIIEGHKQLKQLPEEIGSLKNLDNLFIHQTSIKHLPDSIGNLTKLNRMVATFNNLINIPESIGKLRKLESLRLYQNNIETLPKTIGNLKRLKHLSLYYNSLNEIPETIGNLKQLESIELSNNNLTRLPESIGELTNLKRMTLDKNPLTKIPSSICNLTKLQEITIPRSTKFDLPHSLKHIQIIRL